MSNFFRTHFGGRSSPSTSTTPATGTGGAGPTGTTGAPQTPQQAPQSFALRNLVTRNNNHTNNNNHNNHATPARPHRFCQLSGELLNSHNSSPGCIWATSACHSRFMKPNGTGFGPSRSSRTECSASTS